MQKHTEATNNPTKIPTSKEPAEGSLRPNIEEVAGFMISEKKGDHQLSKLVSESVEY
jgi:hypothetical protein